MAEYNSSMLLDQLRDLTQSFIDKAVNEWQNLPESLLLKQPGENKWSVAQCLEHLNTYGRFYIPAIEKVIRDAQNNQALPVEIFKAGWLGNYFTQLMRPGTEGKKTKKFKAPKDHSPAPALDSHKVLAEFIRQQQKFIELLNTAQQVNINTIRVPVSITRFIKLKLGDTFNFLIIHNHRHFLQAERALAVIKAPAANAN